jgi:hypothetical protein
LDIPHRGYVDQTPGGWIEVSAGPIQRRGDVTVAFDKPRPTKSVGHTIVVSELRLELLI